MSARILLAALLGSLLPLPAIAQAPKPQVVMDTSLGRVRIELFADKAPVSVKNFLRYVDDRYYDGLVFHRVIPNFMIQGGGMGDDLKDKPGRTPIANEAGNALSNQRGTLAVARTSDPNSGTSQFFINLKDNSFLDRAKAPDKVGYAVFGRVVEGMDVVDKITGVKTGTRGTHQNVPLEPVVIRSIRRAGEFTLAVTGSRAPGKLMTVTAQVDFASTGLAFTLVLPPGLRCVEGREIQPVPVGVAPAIVLWKVRGAEPGDFTVGVRSNTGVVRSVQVKIRPPDEMP